MTVRQNQNSPNQMESRSLRLLLQNDVRVWSHAGDDLRPKSRKAQALLAVLALSPNGSLSRKRLASLLWSSSVPSVGRTRLRDLLHDLKLGMAPLGIDILDLQNDKIGLRTHLIHLECGPLDEPSTPNNNLSSLLIDLEGLDPALDRWLIGFRLERRRNADDSGLQNGKVLLPETVAADRCALAITDVSTTNPNDAGVASGLQGEISHILARFRWFRTITRDTKGQLLRIGDQELSKLAHYALISTLRFTEGVYTLFVELIALSHKGQVVWAARYDLGNEAGVARQKDLAERIAARIDTEILLAEVTQSQEDTKDKIQSAYRLVLSAIPAIHRLERDEFVGVGHLLERAVEADPDSSFAHLWLAYWYIFLVGQGWTNSPVQATAKAGRAADRSMVLDPKNARSYAVAGHVRAFITKRLDEASALHDIALQLNPSLPLAWHLAAMTSAYAGRLDEAYSRVNRCQDLAYGDPTAFFSEGALAIVHLLKHEHEQSVIVGQRVTQRHPNFTSAYKSTISALGHLGKKTEARHLVQRLQQLEPQFTLRSFQATAPYRRREDLAHFVTGLRLAGVT